MPTCWQALISLCTSRELSKRHTGKGHAGNRGGPATRRVQRHDGIPIPTAEPARQLRSMAGGQPAGGSGVAGLAGSPWPVLPVPLSLAIPNQSRREPPRPLSRQHRLLLLRHSRLRAGIHPPTPLQFPHPLALSLEFTLSAAEGKGAPPSACVIFSSSYAPEL